MGFKENLKSELLYSGMMVKELSVITGIKRHTLDNYLNTHNSIPNAEAIVKIAQALGVTAEYLVTGKDLSKDLFDKKKQDTVSRDLRSVINIWNRLNKKNRELALALLKTLDEQENNEL
ncbi:MAG: helix-turn-helix domain-containing protein [Treponema sp.]|nr:helix-turn-helix domain-containing protein [Treponema sp.]